MSPHNPARSRELGPTEGVWQIHHEEQPDGSTGYHVAAIRDGEHICIGTFHREADAAVSLLAIDLFNTARDLVGALEPERHFDEDRAVEKMVDISTAIARLRELVGVAKRAG